MREYTQWALQELLGGLEFERLASDCMFATGYERIEVRGGARDGGADAIIRTKGKTESGEEVRFAYSTQKDWESKLHFDFAKLDGRIQINTFVFCTTQLVSGAAKERLAKAYRQSHRVRLIIYDISQFALWLDSTDWGQRLKEKYGLVPPSAPAAVAAFEECLQSTPRLPASRVTQLTREYCKNVLADIKYSVWLDNFLMRKVKSHASDDSSERLCQPEAVTTLIRPSASFVLIAEAGMGKSTTLEFLAAHCSTLKNGRKATLAIHIPLSEIGKYSLYDLIKHEIVLRLPQIPLGQVAGLLHGDSVALLLDGMNEIEDKYFPAFRTDLRHLRRLLPTATIIVTSRPPVEPLGFQMTAIELLALDEAQLQQLLAINGDDQEALSMWNKLPEAAKRMFRNPFYASIVGRVWRKGELPAPAQLISDFATLRLKEVSKSGIPSGVAETLLERVAYTCCLQRRTSFTEEMTLKILGVDAELARKIDILGRGFMPFVSAGLLEQLRHSFVFTHHILQQCFAAKFLRRQYQGGKDITPILEQTFHRGSGTWYTQYYVWEEVAPLLCDLCDDPDGLILKVLPRIDALAAMCIGTSVRRSEHVVRTAVQQFSNRLGNHSIFCLGATESALALPALLLAFRSKEERYFSCHGGDHRTNYECSVPALLTLPATAVDAAMTGLLQDDDEEVKSRAMHFLSLRQQTSDSGEESAKEPKKTASKSDLKRVREEIEKGLPEGEPFELISALEENGSSEAEDLLIVLLSHPSRRARRSAAKSLGNLGCQKAIREIAGIYTWTEDCGVQCAGQGWYWYDLLIALDSIGTSGAANALVDVICSDKYESSSMGEDLLFDVVTKYGDTLTLHTLEERRFPDAVCPLAKKMADRIRFLLSL